MLHAFAVCRPLPLPHLAEVGGLSSAPVRTLRVGELALVVQEVPAESFTEEALRERLSVRAELERCARAHHEVVAAAARSTTVVPLPMATVHAGAARARAAVAERAGPLLAALDRLEGRAEWGVKVYIGPPGPGGTAERDRRSPTGPNPPGAAEGTGGLAYLERLRARRRSEEERDSLVLRVVERVRAEAARVAVATRPLRVHGVEVTGREHRQVLNLACLVEAGRGRELVARVTAPDRRTDPGARVRVEATGPWVPYSFAGEVVDEGR
ncbi:GvpL/GvpF family gas vesicle protein [Streptomyces calidiresistens]|uniref:Gas vesicle protein n=1 Tax=Streptomyces calidiresistens TaxID=1485586 RepID=A0A7W3T652_9ACTN|nr:GvpL/GvpF family gas vesicle protein [Streptomyces calidiresistens]MBB0231644.1 gas vesicle protein [Streptomyces calidiresistens]